MRRFLDALLGSGGQPVRREARVEITFDEEGNPAIEAVEGEAFMMSPEGGLDRVEVVRSRFFNCGCAAEVNKPGGMCGEPSCHRISCASCFGRCERCKRPICLEHSSFLEHPDVKGSRFCFGCFDVLRRRVLRQALVRGLLTPFRRKP